MHLALRGDAHTGRCAVSGAVGAVGGVGATGAPVLIMAGGTGGHVFPALAVAKVLRDRGVPVVWLGVPASMEAKLVPANGFPIEWVRVKGVRGKGLATLALAPLRIAGAVWQALRVLRRVRPRAVLGAGGYVSGPGGIAAWLMRIPLLIHEQNAIPGLTNRWLARVADAGAARRFRTALPPVSTRAPSATRCVRTSPRSPTPPDPLRRAR